MSNNTVRVFDFEVDQVRGARVVVRQEPLCQCCLSDGEIDANIKLLKDDLDAVAKRMKAAIRQQAREPMHLGR
jgi:hypothetical protein